MSVENPAGSQTNPASPSGSIQYNNSGVFGALSGTGLIRMSGTTPSFDNSTYLTSISGQDLSTADNSVSKFISDISGLVTAGSNVTITGSGTSSSPYVIASTGGGGGSQTPWTSNIDGGNYDLSNVNNINATEIDATGFGFNYTSAGSYYQAGSFDGSSYITMPSSSVWEVEGNEFSCSAWIYITNGTAGRQNIVTNSITDGVGFSFAINLTSSGDLGISAEGIVDQVASYSFSSNTWYHVVGVQHYSGGSPSYVELFVNGTSIGTHSWTGNYNTSSGSTAPAIGYESSDNIFSGRIEEVQVYPFALSSGQITTLYSGGVSGSGLYGQVGGAIGAYHLNGNATDYSGNLNNGTWTGTEAYATGGIIESTGGTGTLSSLLNYNAIKSAINVNTKLNLTDGLYDGSGVLGSSGQVLSSTGTKTQWSSVPNYWAMSGGNLYPNGGVGTHFLIDSSAGLTMNNASSSPSVKTRYKQFIDGTSTFSSNVADTGAMDNTSRPGYVLAMDGSYAWVMFQIGYNPWSITNLEVPLGLNAYTGHAVFAGNSFAGVPGDDAVSTVQIRTGQGNSVNSSADTMALSVYNSSLGSSPVTQITANGRYIGTTGGSTYSDAGAGFYLNGTNTGGTDPRGKFIVNSASGGFGQFQVISPGNTEVSFVIAPNSTPSGSGTISANDSDASHIWAFGAGSFGSSIQTFGIGNTALNTFNFYIDSSTQTVHTNTGIPFIFGDKLKVPVMPTADPADGTNTLWYDPATNIVYRGT